MDGPLVNKAALTWRKRLPQWQPREEHVCQHIRDGLKTALTRAGTMTPHMKPKCRSGVECNEMVMVESNHCVRVDFCSARRAYHLRIEIMSTMMPTQNKTCPAALPVSAIFHFQPPVEFLMPSRPARTNPKNARRAPSQIHTAVLERFSFIRRDRHNHYYTTKRQYNTACKSSVQSIY